MVMNHINIVDKKECTGCSACMNICPTKCISMSSDEEGFLYPKVDKAKCTECGLCIKACPFILQLKASLFAEKEPEAYALYHKDKKIRQDSTSGGAFTAICETFCNSDEYVIFGAAYDDNLNVCHSYVTNISNLGGLRKSKYVQSEIGTTFLQAKELLNASKKVLFSGTPCQIAGLKAFLKKPYDNLITVDIVCHGVPTPIIFEKYKVFMEQSYKDIITAIDFRSKRNTGWENSKIRIDFKERKAYEAISEAPDDPFMNAFLSGLSLRPSCRPCLFAGILRVSDITIGDFWGIDEIKPEINDNKGLSVVLVNTEKGRNLFNNIERFAHCEHMDLHSAIKFNGSLIAPAEVNQYREQFMGDIYKMNFESLIKKYLRPRPIITRLATKYLSKTLKQRIKCLIKILRLKNQ